MPNRLPVVLLAGLLVAATVWRGWEGLGPQTPTGLARFVWDGFLLGLPVLLAGLLLAGHRWALMAAVMYGTIGLAMDIATAIQEVTRSEGRTAVLVLSALTGGLNLLLILAAGRGFLTVTPSARPPGDRPPSPRCRP